MTLIPIFDIWSIGTRLDEHIGAIAEEVKRELVRTGNDCLLF